MSCLFFLSMSEATGDAVDADSGKCMKSNEKQIIISSEKPFGSTFSTVKCCPLWRFLSRYTKWLLETTVGGELLRKLATRLCYGSSSSKVFTDRM